MNQTAIFAPFFTMIGLTLIVWIYMYIRRLRFITAENLQPDDLIKGGLDRLSPPAVSNPSDNLKNLFEMPVLFYAVVLYLHATQQVDGVHLIAAWTFVGFRVLHSAVHCTANIVMLRFFLYAASSLALWFMAIRAALAHF